MRNKKSSVRGTSIMLEIASHTVMGIALGFGFSFALALIDKKSPPEDSLKKLRTAAEKIAQDGP